MILVYAVLTLKVNNNNYKLLSFIMAYPYGYKTVYKRLGIQLSMKFQLLAEEKWILEALSKIKNQLNCLQIERLHLESVKAQIRPSSSKNIPETSQVQEPEEWGAGSIPTCAVNLMQNATVKGGGQDEVPIRPDDEAANEEELDLLLRTAAINFDRDMDMEEYEDEESDDDDDMFIDMNMLMNGSASL